MRFRAEVVEKFGVKGVQHRIRGGGDGGQAVNGAYFGVRCHGAPPWGSDCWVSGTGGTRRCLRGRDWTGHGRVCEAGRKALGEDMPHTAPGQGRPSTQTMLPRYVYIVNVITLETRLAVRVR
ncbi:hypothetical protein GCM10011578_001080 [Streptomyces fuscichromogenes]|uniref:Uncharacterized protein n=1 Tax=Streptomyces fuscichromogenes TaxID=1324013 RepID=A0A917UDS1_9ACTN|nr:hypothetical protein GCM10011578_001080 [Streptomyces fuscichromogenes]